MLKKIAELVPNFISILRAKLNTMSKINQESSSDMHRFQLFMEHMKRERAASPSVMDFKYHKKRIRVLSEVTVFPQWGSGVIYWMFRDQRIQDNWALLYAQKLAIKNEVPLYVCFCYDELCSKTWRHTDFMCKGLKEVEDECRSLNIGFHFLNEHSSAESLVNVIQRKRIGAVVIDFFPLKEYRKCVRQLISDLPKEVPLMEVDAHNIVPCWVTSEKREYAARTIRPKINNKLQEFLTEFPPVIRHPYDIKWKDKSVNWDQVIAQVDVDRTVAPVSSFSPGYKAGMKMLHSFIECRLKDYGEHRNDPNQKVLSNLSPWFHFGHISVQRSVLCVRKSISKHKKSVEAFCEEAIIRRELSDNFCFYNENYDNISGAENWAQLTLDKHKSDKRQHIYSERQLEEFKTHDRLWNAAQKQLLTEGKLHGFLRMYWAKKILEWTASPEEALRIAITFNDKYALDGNDPNGYVGCMWSICGTHDQGWAERLIFGKIRYMNFEGCKRKFNVDQFIQSYRC